MRGRYLLVLVISGGPGFSSADRHYPLMILDLRTKHLDKLTRGQ
jgi:hypothetical protein